MADRVVVMGFFNARVGKIIEAWKGVTGRHGEDMKNDSVGFLVSVLK